MVDVDDDDHCGRLLAQTVSLVYHIRAAKGSARVAADGERPSTRDRGLEERRPTRRGRADGVTLTMATVLGLRAHGVVAHKPDA
jgi:hypothetical protein